MITHCHFHTIRVQRNTKIGRVANLGWENSNMAFIFEIDAYLINYQYMMTYSHFYTRRGQRNTKIGSVAIRSCWEILNLNTLEMHLCIQLGIVSKLYWIRGGLILAWALLPHAQPRDIGYLVASGTSGWYARYLH